MWRSYLRGLHSAASIPSSTGALMAAVCPKGWEGSWMLPGGENGFLPSKGAVRYAERSWLQRKERWVQSGPKSFWTLSGLCLGARWARQVDYLEPQRKQSSPRGERSLLWGHW